MKRMASSISYCTSCKTQRANPGYKWCEPCYSKSRTAPAYSHCRHCGNSPNVGYDLCEFCYKKDKVANKPRGKLCLICLRSWAEEGLDVCTGCMTQLDDPAAPLLNQTCNRCKKNPPNPGHLICEVCYRDEQAMMPMNIHGNLYCGMTPMYYPQPIIGGFRPIVPADLLANYAASTDESSRPESDPRTLLNMGSTFVTRKHKETKTSPVSDTNYYHCICPHCYSDTSREDLLYCTHCLVSVVQFGDNICLSCRNNLK